MAAAVLFGAASCAKEDISSSLANGEQVEVTFTANLPELGTRAIGEGESARTLKFFVYEYQNDEVIGTYLPAVKLYTADDEEGTNVITSDSKYFNFSLSLIKGMKYNIVFWADKGTGSPYSVVEENGVPTGVISADYSNVNANDDTLDAFFGALKEFDPAAADAQARAREIKLYRPFAQLNAKTNDIAAVTASGATLTKSSLTVKTYTTLNLFSGEVGGLDEVNAVTFKMNNVLDNNGYISMNYLLAPVTKCTADVTFNYEFEGRSVNYPATTYTYVPLQRNYKTNILGSLLTKSTDFTVEIKPGFTEPDQEPEALFLAAVLGGEVTLTEDVVLTQPLKVESKMTLNLNGHNITTTEQTAGRHYYAINNYGNLTITGSGNIDARGIKNFGEMVVDGNLTITNIDTDGGAAIWNEGKVTINNGNFATNATAGDGSYGAALNTRAGGEAVVNGGNYYAYSQLTYAIVNEGTTTINNAVVKGKHGAIAGSSSATTSIYGGSFELLDNPGVSDHCAYYVSAIYGGKFTLNTNTDSGAQVFYESTIAEGYKAVVTEGIYYVFTEDAKVVTTKDEFSNALALGGEIVLLEDVTLNKIDLTTQTQDVVINANGKTITTNNEYGVQVKPGKNITLKNAIVAITVEGNYITYAAGFKVENGDYQGNTILLENCKIQMINGDWAYAVNMPASVKNLNLVIDKCILEGAIALQCWGDNNTITATNSEFICNYTTSALYTSYCVALQGDGTNKAENNTLNINGCHFSYTGTDNFNSTIGAVVDRSNAGNNTINVVDCTYEDKVTPFN